MLNPKTWVCIMTTYRLIFRLYATGLTFFAAFKFQVNGQIRHCAIFDKAYKLQGAQIRRDLLSGSSNIEDIYARKDKLMKIDPIPTFETNKTNETYKTKPSKH
ncbi:MAG: hypothetical protein EXX96DRAFT_534303 [Benjaminiella poitrasii]|nr:MAG: hypothetical protein EXX96DRAFT_534303 [Benjaminiella poitrasii]